MQGTATPRTAVRFRSVPPLKLLIIVAYSPVPYEVDRFLFKKANPRRRDLRGSIPLRPPYFSKLRWASPLR